MKRFKVVRTPMEAGISNTNEFRDLMGFDWFLFPKVGTVCNTNENESTIMHNGYAVCDMHTVMQKSCFTAI